MSGPQEFAAAFIAWAAEQHLLSYGLRRTKKTETVPETHPDLAQLVDVPLLQREIAPDELEAIKSAFRDNHIHFVGYASGRVVIASSHKISADRKLPRTTRSKIWLEFQSWKAPDILPARGAIGPADTQVMIGSRYPCGASISAGDEIAAGTIGCLVRDKAGQLLGLSNNHVVGKCNDADPRSPIVAPGLLDVQAHGLAPFTLGHFRSLIQLTHGRPGNVDTKPHLDAATFTIANEDAVSSMQQQFYDTPTQVIEPIPDIVVEKVGRTTGHTKGRIEAINVGGVSVRMEAEGFKGRVFFDRCILIKGSTDFALRGDSGALVVTEETEGKRKAVGLVFAVNPDRGITYAAPIIDILGRFDVTLIGDHHAPQTPRKTPSRHAP